ncbi:SseB family protein [Streptomyces qinglanensis]|uniref:SseB protein N-terminal domain-containing protein n=1 Tax=Streptomyces qinglanensis TaxID=943816 RepID=A0A1H9W6T9_9ACTN|nr:SseB family protein [Streptomyces qinglanensis]SES29397.1 SseB protein N-terminal domain-containing protein [Streptomyces qinglanensis]
MSLRDLVHDAAVTRMSTSERLDRLRSARLYFQRPENPGFLVAETVDGPVVPVFTSWEQLALFAGVCDWASTTAEDLVDLLPDGVRALVDPLGERPFLLDADRLPPPETAGPDAGEGAADAANEGPADVAEPADGDAARRG